jgi:hypothetical protein
MDEHAIFPFDLRLLVHARFGRRRWFHIGLGEGIIQGHEDEEKEKNTPFHIYEISFNTDLKKGWRNFILPYHINLEIFGS